MKVIVFYGEADENGIAKILTIHHKPELLDKQARKRGMEVELVEHDGFVEAGKRAVPVVDVNKKTMSYVIEDEPESQDTNTEIQNLKNEINELKERLAANEAETALVKEKANVLDSEISLVKSRAK